MKFRRILSVICALYFAVMLLVPTQVNAATTLTITVPDAHSVELIITGQGLVEVSKNSYNKSETFDVARLSEQKYIVKADEDWQIESVIYAGEEQKETSEKLGQLIFDAPAIREDGNQLIIVFEQIKTSAAGEKDSGMNTEESCVDTKPPEDEKPANTVKSDTLKTGDINNPLIYVIVFLAAGGIILVLTWKHRKI